MIRGQWAPSTFYCSAAFFFLDLRSSPVIFEGILGVATKIGGIFHLSAWAGRGRKTINGHSWYDVGGGGSIINRDDIICQPEAISPLGVSNIPSAFSSASSFKGGLIDSSSLGADARSQTN